MTNIQYIVSIAFKNKYFYLTWILLATAFVGLKAGFTPHYYLYDSQLVIYPCSFVMPGGDDSAVVNPCYKIKRIVESDDFRHYMTADGQLTDRNFARRLRIYETPEHTIVLHAFTPDSLAGLALLGRAQAYINDTYNSLPSSIIKQNTGLEEAQIADYHWDTADCLGVCDPVSSPDIVSKPCWRDWLVLAFSSLVFAMCLAAAGTFIVNQIRATHACTDEK